MSEGIGVALIQLVGTLIATAGSVAAASFAIIAARRAKHARDDTRVIKAEVKNDHKTNLREEADERHTENARKLDQIIETTDDLVKRVKKLEGDEDDQTKRIERIEKTWPRSRFAPPARHREEETP